MFGDPTFRFTPPESARSSRTASLVASLHELDDASLHELDDASLAGRLTGHRAAAVRLEALAQLAGRRSAMFEDALPIAAQDPSELVRRRAVCLMGDVGCTEHLVPILRAALRDSSERVVFKARGAARKFDAAAVRVGLERVLSTMPYPLQSEDREALARSFAPSGFVQEGLETARVRSLPTGERVPAVRTYRLYRAHPAVPGLIALARASDDEPAVRCAALEALGWFVFAAERGDILVACRELAIHPATHSLVRDEAIKTERRLQAGANDSLLP